MLRLIKRLYMRYVVMNNGYTTCHNCGKKTEITMPICKHCRTIL